MELVEKINEVLDLQDKFNKVVNPDWQKADYEFYRAVWLEMAEFIEHVGTWKWWKKAQPGDREQAVLELVDVFHFVLSDAILHQRNAQTILGAYNQALKRKHPNPKDKEKHLFNEIEAFLELMFTSVRQSSGIPIREFFDVVIAYDVTLEELITKYISKNVLNHFRQANGYKSGAYIKEWDAAGNEDNHYLVKYRDELGDSLNFDNLYDKMRLKYQHVVHANEGK